MAPVREYSLPHDVLHGHDAAGRLMASCRAARSPQSESSVATCHRRSVKTKTRLLASKVRSQSPQSQSASCGRSGSTTAHGAAPGRKSWPQLLQDWLVMVRLLFPYIYKTIPRRFISRGLPPMGSVGRGAKALDYLEISSAFRRR